MSVLLYLTELIAYLLIQFGDGFLTIGQHSMLDQLFHQTCSFLCTIPLG